MTTDTLETLPLGSTAEIASASAQSSQHKMRLNFDVLFVVIAFVWNRADIGRLMRTCRTMYQAGVPYLLDGEVYIWTPGHFISLCSFMLDKSPSRFQYLLNLRLALDGPQARCLESPDVKQSIHSFFQSIQPLRILKVGDIRDLYSDKRIRHAICSLPNLQSLHFLGLEKETYPILQNFKSPLKKLEANFHLVDDDEAVDPIYAFRNARFKDTLQELHVTWVEFSSVRAQYPSLTVLFAEDCIYADAGRMFHAFPNMRELTLWMLLEEDTDDEINEVYGNVEQTRLRNIAAQTRGHWETLQYLNGGVLDLYRLALQAKVSCLSLQPSYLRTSDGPRVRTLLSDNRPSTLALRFDLMALDPEVLGSFCAPAVETLTALRLTLVTGGPFYEDPSPSVKTTLSSLASLSIELLHLELDWRYDYLADSFTPEPPVESYQPIPPDPRRPDQPLNTLDVGALAQTAMRSISSLRYICVSLDYRSEFHFEISGGMEQSGGGRRIEQLSLRDGRRILSSSPLSQF